LSESISNEEQNSTFDDSGLACLSLLLAFYQIPTDISQLRHSVGAPDKLVPSDIVRLAKKLGARSSARTVKLDRLDRTPLPLIARGNDGRYFLIGSVRDGVVLIQPHDGPPETIDLTELASRWSGEAVLITTRTEAGIVGKFDVTWFTSALVK